MEVEKENVEEEVIETEEETIEDEIVDEPIEEPEVETPEEEPDEPAEPETKQRAESQIDRLKRERDEWKAKAQKKEGKTGEESNDSVLARLEIRGVTNADDQEFVLDYAQTKGISPIEALESRTVKAELNAMKLQRDKKLATPTPSSRTGKTEKTVAWYLSRGEMPDPSKDRALFEQVQDALIKRSQGSVM